MELFFDLLKTILLGIVQGVTEWLPVSSTGHMILLDEFVKFNLSEEFKEMFFVVIQLGSVLAVLTLFFDKLNPFSKKKNDAEKKITYSLWLKVIIAVVPSAVVGLLFDDWFDATFYSFIPVAVALIVYGVAFIVIERYRKNETPRIADSADVPYKTAFWVGMFQMLALIPGTSRSGSTILGAMLLGLSRTAGAEFSFFMALPTMAGASGLKVLKYVLEGASLSGVEILTLIVGTLTAFLVSLAVIKFLMDFVKRHSFASFGWYRIALGVLVLLYFFVKNT